MCEKKLKRMLRDYIVPRRTMTAGEESLEAI